MNDRSIFERPTALEAILRETDDLGFSMASDPQTGSLLRALAACKPAGRFAIHANKQSPTRQLSDIAEAAVHPIAIVVGPRHDVFADHLNEAGFSSTLPVIYASP
jgi:hypothetical protein